MELVGRLGKTQDDIISSRLGNSRLNIYMSAALRPPSSNLQIGTEDPFTTVHDEDLSARVYSIYRNSGFRCPSANFSSSVRPLILASRFPAALILLSYTQWASPKQAKQKQKHCNARLIVCPLWKRGESFDK